jgi:hypothetical protein
MARVTRQTIFQDALPASEQPHPLPAPVRKAAQAIMPCRTAALGGHLPAGPDGHVRRVWDNSCRPRSCPQCTDRQPERWLALPQARRLAWAHSHVRFPLPHARTPRWLAHVAVMRTVRLQAVRDTRRPWRADPQSLGAPPGIMAALHTWRQTLGVHPPRHCLVTGGGRTPAGTWGPVCPGLLWPMRVVMAVLWGKRGDAIRQTGARGALALPEPLRPPQFAHLLHRLGHPTKTPWHVRIMERYRHGAGVVPYLARSLRGGPIKTARLVAWAGAGVPLPSRAHGAEPAARATRRQRMTVPVADFLPRWLLHVPASHTRGGRSAGLSPHTHSAALPHGRAGLGPPPGEPPTALDGPTVCAQRGDAPPAPCPPCGHLLVCPGGIPRGGAPPPVGARECAAGDRHTTRCGERPGQGAVRLASALWWPVRRFAAVVSRFRGVAHPRPGRRPDRAWGTQAG